MLYGEQHMILDNIKISITADSATDAAQNQNPIMGAHKIPISWQRISGKVLNFKPHQNHTISVVDCPIMESHQYKLFVLELLVLLTRAKSLLLHKLSSLNSTGERVKSPIEAAAKTKEAADSNKTIFYK